MTQKTILNNAYCLAPWVNIHIDNTSTEENSYIKPCCRWIESYNSIDNYFDEPGVLKLKNQLLTNNPSSYCQKCAEREWYSEFSTQELIVDDISDFSIKSLDVRWGPTCQLTCVYCGPGYSSSWAGLEYKKTHIPIKHSRHRDSEFIFNTASKFKIKRVSLLGGEPLLLKENLKLLDLLDDDTSIEIFTNLNVDLTNNEVYQKLTKRSNVNWYVSMENVGVKFEFVRRGASWSQQVSNINHLVNTNPKSVSLQSQYCAYSAFDLVDLYDFSFQHKLHVNLVCENFSINVLDVFSYPKDFKLLALKEVERCLEKFPDSQYALLPVKTKLINDMDVIVPDIIQHCIKWNQEQETKFFNNRFSFVDLWPQFGKISI